MAQLLIVAQLVITLGLTSALMACNSNPFPTDGQILVERPKKEKPEPKYALDLTEVMEFQEGIPAEFSIRAWVPAPGEPVLKFEGLPEEANFDSEKGLLSWTPDFSAANDPSDPSVNTRTYPLEIELRDTADVTTVVRRRAVMIVQNTARLFELKTATSKTLREGEAFSQTIRVESQDYPQGPFMIESSGLPAGAMIEADPSDPNQFTILYQASFDTVTDQDDYYYSNQSFYRDLEFEIKAHGPQGLQTLPIEIEWELLDVPQKPMISAPTEITQGLDVNFTIAAEDLNREHAPEIRLGHEPAFGKISVTQSDNRASASTVSSVLVRWNDIGVEHNGKTENLAFQICLPRRRYNYCEPFQVKVILNAEEKVAPSFDRSHWNLGEIKYLRQSESLEVSLPIEVKHEKDRLAAVTIEPQSLSESISWSEGRLRLSPKNLVGQVQFDVVAKSSFGVTHRESFFAEVFPSSWPSTLILGSGLDDQEARTAKSWFENASVADASIQELDDRMMALRSTLIITTSSLTDTPLEKLQDVWKRANLKNVFVLSPLADSLPGLTEELGAQGVSIAGHPLQVRKWYWPWQRRVTVDVVEGSILSPLSQPTRLRGRTSLASLHPLAFSLAETTTCSPLFEIKKGKKRHPVGVSCATGSRNLVVAGFEWADLKLETADEKVPTQWAHELLQFLGGVW